MTFANEAASRERGSGMARNGACQSQPFKTLRLTGRQYPVTVKRLAAGSGLDLHRDLPGAVFDRRCGRFHNLHRKQPR